jgi:aldose 1-epimerase
VTDDHRAPSGRQHPIVSGDHRAVAVEVGGGIRRYDVEGQAVIAGYAESTMAPKCAGSVLVPWPNRIGGGRYRYADTDHQLALTEPDAGNAIHGLARWSRWTVLDERRDSIALACDVPPQTGYPFEVKATVRWTVGVGGLRVDHTAINVGDRAAPFGLGVHPYLDLAGTPFDDVWLQVPAGRRLLVDDHQIPVGSEPVDGSAYDLRAGRRLGALRLDTGFADLRRGEDGLARVRLSVVEGRAIEVWMDRAFDYVQVFTGDRFDGRADALAIEPMTCAPDAFNSGDGLVSLRPGEEWHGAWGIDPG